uniref:Kinesin motor domain-containing protein n=1 Tax=Haemonchus contortus TaxID=6289 RepID=A0A7I4YMR5_HAECO
MNAKVEEVRLRVRVRVRRKQDNEEQINTDAFFCDSIPALNHRRCIRSITNYGFNNMEGVVKKTKNIRLRAHVVDTAGLPAFEYVSENSTQREQDEQKLQSFDALWKEYCSKFPDSRNCRRNRSSELRQHLTLKTPLLAHTPA